MEKKKQSKQTRRKYDEGFKTEALRMVTAGRSTVEVARSLGVVAKQKRTARYQICHNFRLSCSSQSMPKALKPSQSRALGPALSGIKSNQHPNEFEDQASRKQQ